MSFPKSILLIKRAVEAILDPRFISCLFYFRWLCGDQSPIPFSFLLVRLVMIRCWLEFLMSLSGFPRIRSILPTNENIKASIIFGLSILLIYLSDRTHVFLKGQKQYNPWTFGIWSLFSLIVGISTLQKSDKDLGFLSRQQTDEWKGWMQSMLFKDH